MFFVGLALAVAPVATVSGTGSLAPQGDEPDAHDEILEGDGLLEMALESRAQESATIVAKNMTCDGDRRRFTSLIGPQTSYLIDQP